MEHKKILYLYSKMIPDNCSRFTLFAGGAQKRVFQMASYFNDHGCKVFLASDDKINSRIIVNLEKKGIEHIKVYFRHGGFGRVFTFFKLIIFVFRKQVDLIHCNDRFTAAYGRFVSILTNTPMIYTARNTFDDKKYTKFFFGNRIVAISHAVEHNLTTYFNIEPYKIKIIYNGTDVKCQEFSCTLKDQLGLADKERVFAYVGRFSNQKGLEYLINAIPLVIQYFPTIKLLLIGDGELKSKLKDLVNDLRLGDSIVFISNQKDVSIYYSIIEFTVIPSIFEGLGVSAIESIMLGKPVIATNVGGLPEIIQDNVNGLLIPPKNSIALSNAIINLLANPEKAQEMGYKGTLIGKEKFGIQKMFNNYEDYYKAVIN